MNIEDICKDFFDFTRLAGTQAAACDRATTTGAMIEPVVGFYHFAVFESSPRYVLADHPRDRQPTPDGSMLHVRLDIENLAGFVRTIALNAWCDEQPDEEK